MFAITGISGQVGGAVARALLAAGRPVRAVVRDPAKGEPWARQGCEVALASLDDAGALRSAFAGCDGVFFVLPPVFDPAPDFAETRRVVAAVRDALDATRPARLVSLSTIGAQATRSNLLSQHGLQEAALGALPIPVTFLRAAWFMENAAWDVAPARETGVVPSFLQPLDRAIPMVATADVGTAAAALLQESWTGRRVVEVESARVAPNDLAAALARALRRDVRAQAVPRASWHDLFAAQGMSNPGPRIAMLDGFNEGWIGFDGDAASRRQGATTLDAVIGALVRR